MVAWLTRGRRAARGRRRLGGGVGQSISVIRNFGRLECRLCLKRARMTGHDAESDVDGREDYQGGECVVL